MSSSEIDSPKNQKGKITMFLTKWLQSGTLESGHMDQNLRNTSCLILSHTQMEAKDLQELPHQLLAACELQLGRRVQDDGHLQGWGHEAEAF